MAWTSGGHASGGDDDGPNDANEARTAAAAVGGTVGAFVGIARQLVSCNFALVDMNMQECLLPQAY